MEFRIRLPGLSLDEDLAIAGKAVELAVKKLHARLVAEPAPAHARNPCDDAGCAFLGTIVVDGVTYLLYLCADGTVECYEA